MSMEEIGTYAVAFFVLVGAVFMVIGAIGLLRFNDQMTRLHAPTKVGTLGIGALLMASMTNSYVFGDGSFHELLIMAFLFVTAPISANFISKVHIHLRASMPTPEAPGDQTWSTLDKREGDVAPEPSNQPS